MALTPTNYSHGRGVFVPSKGKLSLIVDTNKDDVADQEIIIADGWKELPHGVDALGVAVAADGTIYFGLGAANFYGRLFARRKNPRGSLPALKVNAARSSKWVSDFSRREIFCTGIRFPVALAFNYGRGLVLHRPGRSDLVAQWQSARRIVAPTSGAPLWLSSTTSQTSAKT
jgi:glucose/arabinose dehydrogenase